MNLQVQSVHVPVCRRHPSAAVMRNGPFVVPDRPGVFWALGAGFQRGYPSSTMNGRFPFPKKDIHSLDDKVPLPSKAEVLTVRA